MQLFVDILHRGWQCTDLAFAGLHLDGPGTTLCNGIVEMRPGRIGDALKEDLPRCSTGLYYDSEKPLMNPNGLDLGSFNQGPYSLVGQQGKDDLSQS